MVLLIISLGAVAVLAAEPNYPATLMGGAPCGSCHAPANLSSKTFIPESKTEPGEPLEISGKIYQEDGKTPAPGVVLFVYHTDTTGYYNEDDDASHPRLRGWIQTDADGRYEFRTIRPGPYPHRTTPAHIHAHVYGKDYSERPIADFWFEGDRFITPEAIQHASREGEKPAIVPLKKDADGVWRGTRDITLKPAAK